MSAPASVVVVGAGLAGLRTCEALRGHGYDGKITLLGAEAHLPYDRPPLSKDVLTGKREDTTYRDATSLRDLDLCLRWGTRATGLDLTAQTVLTTDDQPVPFDALVLATGSTARTLDDQGLSGIHTLRTVDDARALRSALRDGPRVVVIGAGFIGSEVASSARSLGLDTTIVEAAPVPLARAVGPEMGGLLARLHTEHGTRLITGTGVDGLMGDRHVEGVRLTDGRILPADLVVVGIGAVPDTDWLARSGLTVGNGLVCDEYLRSSHPTVYAAGDLACWPNPLFGQRMRCEHWTNAVEQARTVATNLLAPTADQTAFTGSGYFWSTQYGVQIQFTGIPTGDTVEIFGSLEDGHLLALYRSGDRLTGALGIGVARQIVQAKLLIERRGRWTEARDTITDTEPALSPPALA